jgi:hypothetical protein
VKKGILDGHEVILIDDTIEWAKWFEKAPRHVANTQDRYIRVSTVFLGIDHGFGGKPLWFETMIFGGEHDGFQERYETWAEAELGHFCAVKLSGVLDVNHLEKGTKG